ncbi:bifunctional acetate--CoA ligase family protein/GNAT family N-acetyltransferase [Micrococcoides hystricis]|uniref:GNAT family N-acetyltransferase n=1 Tax=Micrococcoides hystricis TaxID=1572761 RepID=A0ABV6P6W5_9MICC
MVKQNETADYPSHWEADVVLRDGATAHLRPVSPADAEALQRMHQGQSETSIYLRFFTYKASLSDAELERFTHVDYRDRVAFVITIGDDIAGIGRYDRLDDPLEAEVAFMIADAHQGRGLGSILIEHLAAAARERGIRRFSAEVLPENRTMLVVFQESGFDISRRFDDGVVVVEFSIDPTERSRAVMESREHRAEAKSIAEIVNPRSVAVIGASRYWGKVGHRLLESLVENGFNGHVVGINPEAFEVGGTVSFAGVSESKEPIELAVVAVPKDRLPEVVEECGKAGVKGLLIITAGFEYGNGMEVQRSIVRQARRWGMRVVGPASAGIINTDPEISLNASPSPTLPLRGSLGLFTQSAAITIALFASAVRQDIGFSSVLSAGNRADVSGNDMMQYWEDDPNTRAVALYLESFGNPRKFVRIARRLSRTKPVIVTKSDMTGRRIPAGHQVRTTQASPEATRALLAQAGVTQARNHDEMMDVCRLVSTQNVPAGSRVGIISNSPALAQVSADTADQLRLDPTLIIDAVNLDQDLPAARESMRAALADAIASPKVDALLVVPQAGLNQGLDECLEDIANLAATTDKPVLVTISGVLDEDIELNSIAHAGEVQEAGDLQAGVPCYSNPARALKALALLARYRDWLNQDVSEVHRPEDIDQDRAAEIVAAAVAEVPGGELKKLSEKDTAALLASYGVHLLETIPFETPEEAVAAAEELGWPVALKATDSYLRHRLDLGGVRLNIPDEASLRANITQMRALLEAYGSPGLEVQSMVAAGQGCAVRAIEDPLHGPVLSFGVAGDAVDLLNDWAHASPPLTQLDLDQMIRTPKASAKLFGYQQMPPVDAEAVKDVLNRIGLLKDDFPQVVKLKLSPLLAAADSATVLAAEIHVANAEQRTDSARRALSN